MILGGGSGAAKGAVIGGAAGTGVVLATRGEEVTLSSASRPGNASRLPPSSGRTSQLFPRDRSPADEDQDAREESRTAISGAGSTSAIVPASP